MLRGLLPAGRSIWLPVVNALCILGSVVFVLGITENNPAYAMPQLHSVRAIPAFARKYGLPCSACHTAWPELNYFWMAFRDRGYQLGNERDSPVWQNPSDWPATVRITPNWHFERTSNQILDSTPAGSTGENVTQQGFDL